MFLHRLAITLLLCLGAAQRARVNPYSGSDSEDLERKIVEVSADGLTEEDWETPYGLTRARWAALAASKNIMIANFQVALGRARGLAEWNLCAT